MLRRNMYIVDGSRTPFMKFNTSLADEPAAHLGISPAKAAITSAGLDPTYVDEVIFGCCNQPTDTLGNIARFIGVRCGVPENVPAVTVHRNCASGFEAITYACDKAAAEKGDVFLVGGLESMSRAPFTFSQDAVKKFIKLSKSKTLATKLKSICSFRPVDLKPHIALEQGMVDGLCDMGMGQTAELLAREFAITRQEQDEFAQLSHLRAVAHSDVHEDHISTFHCTESNCLRSSSGKVLKEDNGVRNDISLDKLGRLKTIFDRREGTVTAGNSSQVTDGGAALLLMTARGIGKTGCKPLAEIVDYAYAGCDPKRMGLGPVPAMAKLCRTVDKRVADADLIEINEAFAAQVLAACKYSKDVFQEIPLDKLNLTGGAIALGHPLAATGARLVLSTAKELRRKGLQHGLTSLCVGGGQGGAIWIRAV